MLYFEHNFPVILIAIIYIYIFSNYDIQLIILLWILNNRNHILSSSIIYCIEKPQTKHMHNSNHPSLPSTIEMIRWNVSIAKIFSWMQHTWLTRFAFQVATLLPLDTEETKPTVHDRWCKQPSLTKVKMTYSENETANFLLRGGAIIEI